MAVTTATLLGVAMPLIDCGVETPVVLVDAGERDPPQPASTPATAARHTMQRSLIRNLLKLISNTCMSVTCWRPTRMLGQSAAAMSVARPTIGRLSTRYLYYVAARRGSRLERKRLEALGLLPQQTRSGRYRGSLVFTWAWPQVVACAGLCSRRFACGLLTCRPRPRQVVR